MFTDTFIIQNCEVTSPSVGTIRVSCDLSHQIQVSIVCVDNKCDKFAGGSNGYSPLTETGFDPGKVYTVFINVIDGNQVVSNDERITQTITVISTTSSKICDYANSRRSTIPNYCMLRIMHVSQN